MPITGSYGSRAEAARRSPSKPCRKPSNWGMSEPQNLSRQVALFAQQLGLRDRTNFAAQTQFTNRNRIRGTDFRKWAPAIAKAKNRSAAGSVCKGPARGGKESWSASCKPQCCSKTAITMASRLASMPVLRFAEPKSPNHGSGLPANTESQTAQARDGAGSGHSIRIEQGPPALNGLQALSCHFEEPNLHRGAESVFDPRTTRWAWCKSPSKDNTTSTMCSSTQGPPVGVLGDIPHRHDGGTGGFENEPTEPQWRICLGSGTDRHRGGPTEWSPRPHPADAGGLVPNVVQ